MNKRASSFNLILISLLLVLMLPAGIALAGSDGQPLAQSLTPTAAPTSTSQPQPYASFFAPQIPGISSVSNFTLPIPDTTETFSFQDFGLEEITLRGPFASSGYYYDLPATWKMKPGGYLRFSLDVFYTGASTSATAGDPALYGGTLLVQYNYETIAAIDLGKEGQIFAEIPLSLDALNSLGGNKGHALVLVLDSGINCDEDFTTTVVVRPTSQLYLPHDLIEPPVDLRKLPSPFYQNTFNQEAVLVALPDQPTAQELQSALAVIAGLGRMSYNRLLINLSPVGQVPADVWGNANIIFVGKADAFPLLASVSLPAPVLDGMYAAVTDSSSDGIVQMGVSPWNRSKVVMVVGGNDDEGVVRAAQAVSTGSVQVGTNSSLAIVSNVQLAPPIFNLADVNQTLSDLGYESIVAREIGLNYVDYLFNIPPDYILGPDAYLDLIFSHTSLLEYQRSTVVVKLNDQPIGSVRLSDETISQGNAKIFLPASATRPGSNSLTLEINLEPRNVCVNPILDGLWMRIDSASSLHLPLVLNPASASILLDLAKYPSPFVFDPLMKDLAFILAPNDPVGWNVAAQIASSLGNIGSVQLAGLKVFYADSIPVEALQEQNLMIVGKPSSLPILSDLYESLPAPFEPGSDLAIEKNLQVSYHLEPGTNVGYLQLLPSPWNSKQTILYAGGSTDLGVQWTGAVLRYGRLRSRLSGNMAFINGEQVVTADTRIWQGFQGASSTALPGGAMPALIQPFTPERPEWILPAIYIASGGSILTLLIIGIQALFQKRTRK